jgi:hypothetical protein
VVETPELFWNRRALGSRGRGRSGDWEQLNLLSDSATAMIKFGISNTTETAISCIQNRVGCLTVSLRFVGPLVLGFLNTSEEPHQTPWRARV